MKKRANLELTPEAMYKIAEEAVKTVVDHIAALPKAPRSNLERCVNSANFSRLNLRAYHPAFHPSDNTWPRAVSGF